MHLPPLFRPRTKLPEALFSTTITFRTSRGKYSIAWHTYPTSSTPPAVKFLQKTAHLLLAIVETLLIHKTILKHIPLSATGFLTSIFNRCLALEYFPSRWKSADIVMIPKRDKDPTNPNSYRSISAGLFRQKFRKNLSLKNSRTLRISTHLPWLSSRI